MSIELTEEKKIGTLSVTSFWGGEERGKCLQFTIEEKGVFIQLRREQVVELMLLLARWLLASEKEGEVEK